MYWLPRIYRQQQQQHESIPVGEMSQQQYLHSNGWQTESLHEQSWAPTHMNQFQSKINGKTKNALYVMNNGLHEHG